MLHENERKQVKRLLRERFNIEELERLVSAAGEDYDSVVRQNANKLDAVMDIIDRAELDGWCMELLDAMVEDFDERLGAAEKAWEIAKVREVKHNLTARWGRGTALEDPFQSRFVRGDLPFVNRPQISAAFSKLAQTAGFRIVVVNGLAGSGKSYSKELPQYVSEIQGFKAFKVYYRDLSEGDYALPAEKLVQSILVNWQVEATIPPQMSQSSSYAAELSEWLAAKTPRGETWWLIIDGLAKLESPDPGLLNFLMALARHVADSPHALKLVLLDLGDKYPLPPSAELLASKVRIEPLSAGDLVDHFFVALHQARRPESPVDAQLLETKAQWILDQAHARATLEERRVAWKTAILKAVEELKLI